MASGPSTLELVLRLGLSLGAVMGLLVAGTRIARRVGLGGARGAGRGAPTIALLDRRPLTRGASLALVRVSGRTLLLGVTEHGVSLLATSPGADARADADIDIDIDTGGRGGRRARRAGVDGAHREPVTAGPIDLDRPAPAGPLREAERTAPPDLPGGAPPDGPPRMSLVDALRELTLRR